MSFDHPKIMVVGARGMGAVFGAILREGGLDVTLYDPNVDHVRAIQFDGLQVEGFGGLRVVEAAAQAREPHRIAFYLYDLAAAFHAFWNAGNEDPAKRVILTQDPKLSGARLYLVAQIGQVIRNGLGLLGVEAVEEM